MGKYYVEALAASWIEIITGSPIPDGTLVEALAASWIEIVTHTDSKSHGTSRSPCGFVD